MAKLIKLIKKYMRRIQKRPWMLWALGGGLAVAVVVLGVILVLALRPDQAPTFGPNTTTISLVAGGDLNVTDNTIAAGQSGNGYDYTAAFLDVAQILAEADAAVVNFEGNFCGAPYGSATVSAPVALAQGLKAMGVDFLQMANSCPVKNGMMGLQQTLDAIRSAGLEPVGAYGSNAEAAQQQGFILREIGGVRVALVAFTKGMDGMGLPAGSDNCVNLLYTDYTTTYKKINTDGITKILEAAEAAKPDITIALLHWGSEGNASISPSQEKIAKLMLSLGVDAIIGTHSHQVQRVVYDEEKSTLVAYSLGDFFGDGQVSGSYYSILLRLQITKDLDSGYTAITGWEHIPLYIQTPQRDEASAQVLQIRQAIELYENNHISAVSKQTYENMKAALEQIEKRILPPPEK
jgi:poly-gamma-glutamate synthesis protein (capsule biosynthesis protein)